METLSHLCFWAGGLFIGLGVGGFLIKWKY